MRNSLSIICGLFLGIAVNVHASEFSSLEERMSKSEFQATGLDKLTPEELKNLNDWLRGHPIVTNASNDRTGFPPQEMSRETITSTIEGTFKGWSGNTLFKLQNGQQWEQVENDSFSVKALQNPQITIQPGLLGGWLLKVEGYNRSVRVKRIR